MANAGDSSFGCSGRVFATSEIALIREVVATCRGLSRKELANTISELVGWTRANGSLKEAECLKLLARLEAAGLLHLPAKQATRPLGSITSIPHTAAGAPGVPLSGRVETFAPVSVEPVGDSAARQQFRELVDRYHPLGYKVPFGAYIQYLVSVTQPERMVVGCLQFSSAAWRIAVRDRWIGWDDATRARHLPLLVNNSRFLLLAWVQIKNLASATLARALRRLPQDGRPTTASRHFWWRPSWIRNRIPAPAIGRRIGWRLGRRADAGARIPSIVATVPGRSGCSSIS